MQARWGILEGDKVTCALCPHECVIGEGELGRCRARGVQGGVLHALNYGQVCAQAVDQIEKKPIYHYRPGSRLLSLGTFGCNLDCDCCQNAALASSGPKGHEGTPMAPEAAVALALDKGVQGIAFTFNEPVVWSEYVLDVASVARRYGLYIVMNTNGFVQEGPLAELIAAVDVFKVDVKGFTEGFYQRHCGGTLSPVLRTCERIYKEGRPLELAYLIIPGLNDGTEELTGFFEWVARELGKEVPVHLYRFMPAHRLSGLEPTDMRTMEGAKGLGTGIGLRFIYLSGMVEGKDHRTFCPRCGKVVIERSARDAAERIVFEGRGLSRFCPSYSDIIDRTVDGRCPECGEIIYKKV